MPSSAAIITPVYRFPLSEDERISWDSIRKHLSSYDHYVVFPKSLDEDISILGPEIKTSAFADWYFKNIEGYNSLLLSLEFYERFSKYDYLLIVQLDALVLKNELGKWCAKGWDYIGAPWTGFLMAEGANPLYGVGNGGFSLRNTRSALRVLKTPIHRGSPMFHRRERGLWGKSEKLRFRILHKFLSWKKLDVAGYAWRHFRGNEDVFWGKYAVSFEPSFRVADVDDAFEFAFETEPRKSLIVQRGKLPFGCHAWARFDREFWLNQLKDSHSA